MSRYNKYKDSGIDWIGEIPAAWKLRRFKSDFSYVKGKNPKDTYYADEANGRETNMPYLSMEYLRNDNAEGEFPLLEEKLVSVEDNETLLLWDGSNAGEFIKSKKGFLSSTMVRIDHNSKINGRYSFYIFQCYERILRDFTNGMGIPHVNGVLLNNSYLPITVDEGEQLAIAEYLDEQTHKIDQLIVNKKAQAEKLKELRLIEINNAVTKGLNSNAEMKDSGIDWLSEIPRHWQVKRLKNVTEILRGKFTHRPRNDERLYENGTYPFIQTGNIRGDHMYIEGYNQTLNEFGYAVSKEFPINTVVMSIAANIGDVAILNFNACFPDSIVGFYPYSKLDFRFLYFGLLNLKSEFMKTAVQNTQLNLNIERISIIELPIPPKEEQIQIANFLQQRIASIDKLIKNLEDQIENLQELRKIKIYEAVTGKIKVNAYAEATA